METNINELINTLEILNPKKLEEIRQRNPDYTDLLASGVTLGVEEKENTDKAELLLKAEICREANLEMLKKCDEEFPKIKRRIKNYKKLNLISQIVAAVCSATVLTTIKQNAAVAITFGIISLITSLIPLINEYIITGINNKKITESFEDLIKYRIEIENYNKELAFIIKSGTGKPEKIAEIINNCNATTAIITQLLMLS